MKKYHNAIQRGTMRARESLAESYTIEMTQFLIPLEKEINQAKQDGQLDEKEADIIIFFFYAMICEKAVLMGDIFW